MINLLSVKSNYMQIQLFYSNTIGQFIKEFPFRNHLLKYKLDIPKCQIITKNSNYRILFSVKLICKNHIVN